ncbi:MAG: hypothetical protein FGM46_07885, partial [Ferruginibacter sp.]|nr:hypothetical protein [Ferruginibacter sp.]
MQQLTYTYGHCIIPKNTWLFRGHADESVDDCMFFATKHWVAGAFNDKIQVWKTVTDIEILFLVDYIKPNCRVISALPRLYKNIFPSDSNSNLNDLDIKHWDIGRRNGLARQLFDEYNIYGWLSSIEDKVELEVCLFDKQTNSRQLILVDTTDRNSKKYFKDSLQRIKIFPPKAFYDKTAKELTTHSDIEESYKQHQKYFNVGIKHYTT